MKRIAVLGCLLAGSITGGADEVVIQSLDADGELTFSETTNVATYDVEWADAPDETWSTAGPELEDIPPSGGGIVVVTIETAQARAVFRVTAAVTNPPPAGMSLVSEGGFLMGDNYNLAGNDASNVHSVFVSAFYMDAFEVSNQDMRDVLQYALDQGLIGATVASVTNLEGDVRELLDLDDPDCEISFTNGAFSVDPGKLDFPCVEMTWFGAMAYCNYLSDREGLARAIDFTDWSIDAGQPGYRLPTEAEWEKAARGGLVGHHYPWPSDGGSYTNHIDGSRANYFGSGDPYDDGTTPVGYYNGGQTPAGTDMANGYGLYDMAGNVWEWCFDWYGASWYNDAGATQDDTQGPASGSYHVIRGGGWLDEPSPDLLRCADRSFGLLANSLADVGFRAMRRP